MKDAAIANLSKPVFQELFCEAIEDGAPANFSRVASRSPRRTDWPIFPELFVEAAERRERAPIFRELLLAATARTERPPIFRRLFFEAIERPPIF